MTEKVKVPAWFDDFYKQKSEQGKRDIQLIYGLANLQNTDLRWLDEESSAIKTRPINNKDRLRFIKAIVNGYEVGGDGEQKYALPMEGTSGDDAISNGVLYAFKGKSTGRWCTAIPLTSLTEVEVTQSQLDKAPAWVKAIKPVPVDDPDYGIGIYS